MKHTLTTLVAALLLGGVTHAQTPPTSPKPPAAVKAAEKQAKAAEKAIKAARREEENRAPTSDEELALAALEGLMAQPGDRALPIIRKVLAGPQSTLVKKRALFVLSQIDAPEARELLAQASRSSDEGLRREAIRSIGIGGDPKLLDSLSQIYGTGDAEAKRDVLQAWLIAGRKESVYQAALNAKTEDEATEAIHILGVMGAAEELRRLSDRPNAARGLVDALAISGDLAGLRKIAEGTGEHSVRVDAVRRIGIVQGEEARNALREIYTRSTDAEIREAATQGMLIAQDEQGLLNLYRAAKTAEEKRSLLRMLSMINGDAALQAIDAALEKKTPEDAQ
ncbi:MAG TPA: HEAT repeat domain-containing protein [Steroidobacteraceae bacterium]|nr:HEAT repeat domain-containing protein [Steroidobacteraceae bacterium]